MAIDHVYAGPNPQVISAAGIRLRDVNGRVYIDGEACNGGALFGFDPSLFDAATRHLAGLPAAPSFVETQSRIELATRLRALFEQGTGGRTGRVIFETSGAVGIETAVKLCANRLGSCRIFALAGAYHGRSMFTSSLSGSFRYRQTAGVNDYPVTRLPVCADDDADAVAVTRVALQYLRNELWGASVAHGYRDRRVRPILLFEAYQNVGGGVRIAGEYLRALCDEVHNQGGLVIADETYSGLFRTGGLWGYSTSSVQPDVVVGCKAFSNAMAPFSAIWAADEVCRDDIAKPGLQSSTFSSCQTNIAIVSAVLDRVQQTGLSALADSASHIGEQLRRLGDKLNGDFECIRAPAVHGCVLKLDVTIDASRLREVLLLLPGDRLLVAATGLARHTVLITPALVATEDDIDQIGELLREGLQEVSR